MLNHPGIFRSDRVVANGVSLRYHRSYGDKPPLVLAHGMTDMGLCWSRVARSLVDRYDIVLYDARGHGESDAPKTGHDPLTRSHDLLGLVQTLNLAKPRLLGHSLGAVTVALLAAHRPELAHSIVLEDPPLPDRLERPPAAERVAEWDKELLDWRSSVVEQLRSSKSELEQKCRRQSPQWHESEIEPWAEAKLRVSPLIFDIPNLRTNDWWHALPRITCPTLLLTGEPQRGAMMTEPAERELRRICPRLSLVRLTGAGHNIHREQFDRFISLVVDFFERA